MKYTSPSESEYEMIKREEAEELLQRTKAKNSNLNLGHLDILVTCIYKFNNSCAQIHISFRSKQLGKINKNINTADTAEDQGTNCLEQGPISLNQPLGHA